MVLLTNILMKEFQLVHDNSRDHHTLDLIVRNGTISLNYGIEKILDEHGIEYLEGYHYIYCDVRKLMRKVFFADNLDFIDSVTTIVGESTFEYFFFCALRYSSINTINYFINRISHIKYKINLCVVAERNDDNVQILDLIVSHYIIDFESMIIAAAKCSNVNMWKYLYGIMIKQNLTSQLSRIKRYFMWSYYLDWILSYLIDNNDISENDIIYGFKWYHCNNSFKEIIKEAIDSGKLKFTDSQLSILNIE
jgi:hypothetical protein